MLKSSLRWRLAVLLTAASASTLIAGCCGGPFGAHRDSCSGCDCDDDDASDAGHDGDNSDRDVRDPDAG